MTSGLPDPASYRAMLDGAWAASSWDVAEIEPDPSATLVRPDTSGPLRVKSAALTDPGPVRSNNQDAFLEHTERGLWAVADGMGGLSEGEIASRMVCDSLLDVPVVADLDEAIEGGVTRLREVNAYLRRAATRAVNPVQSGQHRGRAAHSGKGVRSTLGRGQPRVSAAGRIAVATHHRPQLERAVRRRR